MRVHTLQHVPFEGLGSLENTLRSAGHGLSFTHLYRGETTPAPAEIDALIVLGGPMGVHDQDAHLWLRGEKRFLESFLHTQKPILGICLGAQLLADVLGAKVYLNRCKEIGWFPIERSAGAEKSPLGRALPPRLDVFHWHGDTFDLPDGAIHLARSEACENQAFLYELHALGLQFHLETTPVTARALIENCRAELVPVPFIQDAETLLSDAGRFERINAVMQVLLKELLRPSEGRLERIESPHSVV